MARGLKFGILEVEGLYYPCSENKGADQLCGYRTADLRLCFSHMQKAGFLITRLIYDTSKFYIQIFKTIACLYGCKGWCVSNMVKNPADRFSHDETCIACLYGCKGWCVSNMVKNPADRFSHDKPCMFVGDV